MKSEFMMAINQICSERSLSQEVIYEAIESALVSAYKRNYGSGSNIKATIDFETGSPHVYEERIVTEDVEDDRFEITLADALKLDPKAEMGSLVRQEVTPSSFGRIAAQTARQVILQRIREAERDALFSSYADREGELINGMVANITSQAITLNLGRTEAVMPRNQQVPGERYRIGQRIRAYVMEVRRTSRGPQIVVSRTHRYMLRRLLELEVPEIFNGTVEIKSIAREAGMRSKVAVVALQDGVDPVGSCVGIRGMRIQSIVNELGGEKIDVVEWSPDTATFIASALSPAKVRYVILGDPNANGKTATVVVPDDQLSLAIGKEGQNARLGAKLTGWRIDIKSASEAEKEDLRPREYRPAVTAKEKDILAMAEAILLGKQVAPSAPVPAPDVEEAVVEAALESEQAIQVEPEATPVAAESPLEAMPAVAEVELEPIAAEPLTILAAAEALLDEQETAGVPGAAPVAEAEPVMAQVPELVPMAEEEAPELALEAQETLAEPALETRTAATSRQRPRDGYRYVEDERLEEIVSESRNKAGRKKRSRQLVLDEKSGKLISRRKHKKRGGDEGIDWEDADY